MSASKKIRTVIADDEPAARESVQALLKARQDTDVIAMCKDGKETAEAILELKPDLVFLDIQMPELNGFEVLEVIKDSFLPAFVFVTAFDRYALKAFEKSAIDYLLKPYDDKRFYQSLEKAKQWIYVRNNEKRLERIENVLALLQNPVEKYVKRLIAKNQGQITFIPVETVLTIESEGNFVKVHTSSGMKMANYTFKQLSEILDPKIFVRVHKSHIVNRNFVEKVEPYFHGDHFVILKGGSKIKLSRNYKASLDVILNQY
jgi:two-component system LytT family response regulator